MDLPEVFKLLLPLKPEGRSQPGRSGLHETRDGHTTGCIVVEKTVTLKSPESQPSAVYSQLYARMLDLPEASAKTSAFV